MRDYNLFVVRCVSLKQITSVPGRSRYTLSFIAIVTAGEPGLEREYGTMKTKLDSFQIHSSNKLFICHKASVKLTMDILSALESSPIKPDRCQLTEDKKIFKEKLSRRISTLTF